MKGAVEPRRKFPFPLSETNPAVVIGHPAVSDLQENVLQREVLLNSVTKLVQRLLDLFKSSAGILLLKVAANDRGCILSKIAKILKSYSRDVLRKFTLQFHVNGPLARLQRLARFWVAR